MPAPECSHDSMQSTVGGQGRMLGERYALGRHAGSGGWGRCIGPRPRAPAHVAIKMLGHPYAQESALVARFTQEGAGRCRPEPSQHCRWSSTAAPRRACTIWPWSRWRRNPRRPHQHRGVARVPPGGKAGELVDELVKDPPGQASPAGGRRLPPGRGARRPRRGLTVLTGRAAPAHVGPHSFANPSLEQSDG
jgi:hypothetical protein